MKLWQFAILWHPTDKERENDAKDKLVVGVTTVLAKDQQMAAILAAREIPQEWLGQIDQLEIAVRPF